MTTGSWNKDAFSYVSGTSGPWTGRKWSRSWSGTDYGEPPPFNKSESHTVMRFGLGAGHANEIFEALAEADSTSRRLDYKLTKDGKRAEYLRKKAEAERLKEAKLKLAWERQLTRVKTLIAQKRQHEVEKEWRKLHHVPFPKALLNGPPPRDYIPRSSFSFRKPANSNPKPPKRALVEDHPYNMTETFLSDELVTYPVSFHPYNPVKTKTVAVMNSFGSPSWIAQTLLGSNDQVKLVNKLQEKLQGADFNLGVFIAEGNQTLELIGDVATRTAKALNRITRGDFYGTARALFGGRPSPPLHKPAKGLWGTKSSDLNTLAARVLEFQYGIKPLFKDAYAAGESLAHQLNQPYVKTYRVGVRKESVLTTVSQWSIELQFAPYSKLASATAKSVRTHSRHLIARIEEADLPTLPAALGLLDPEVILWEKIPFSFVADWFIPVGPYLEARAAVSRLRGTFVTSDKMVGVAHPPQSAYFQTTPSFHGNTSVNFTRAVSSSLSVTMPHVKPLSSSASFQHCLNGLALITSFATGHSRIR